MKIVFKIFTHAFLSLTIGQVAAQKMESARLAPLEKALMMGNCSMASQLRPLPSVVRDDWYSAFLYDYCILICTAPTDPLPALLTNSREDVPRSYVSVLDALGRIRQDEVSDAVGLLKQARNESHGGTNAWLYYELSRADSTDGPAHLENLEKCISIEPRFYAAVLELLEFYDLVENREEMLGLLVPLQKDYETVDLFNYLGAVHFTGGNFEESGSWFKRSIGIQPNADGFAGIARVLDNYRNDYPSAIAAYSRSLELEWDSQVATDLAWLYHAYGENSLAEEQLRTAASRERNAEAFCQLIVFYLRRGQYEKASLTNEEMQDVEGFAPFMYDAHVHAIGLLSKAWSILVVQKSAEQYEERYEDNEVAIRYLVRLLSL